MKPLLVSAAFLFAVGAGMVRADDAPAKPKGDLAKFQGTWAGKMGPEKDIPISVTFEGAAVTVKVTPPNGQEVELKGEVKVDDAAKPHKTLDWTKLALPDGNTLPDRLGIYEFTDADTVRICSGAHDAGRPDAFADEKEAGEPSTLVLKREAKAPAAEAAKAKPEGQPAPSDEAADADEPKKDEAKKDEPLKGDIAKLQGTWTAKVGPDMSIPIAITFEGKDVVIHVSTPNNGDIDMKGQVKIDDAAKPLKTIDWVKFETPMGGDAPENRGVYEFVDADTLKICNGGPGNERPTELKAGENGQPQVITLKREAKKAAK